MIAGFGLVSIVIGLLLMSINNARTHTGISKVRYATMPTMRT
jgi:hypothetical protein